MAEIRDRSTGEDFKGTTWRAIAEEVWGKGCYAATTEQLDYNSWMGEIRKRTQRDGSAHILASVILTVGDDQTADEARDTWGGLSADPRDED